MTLTRLARIALGFAAPDDATARRVAARMQRMARPEVPFIPLGLVRPPQAWRRSLTGILRGDS